MSWRVAISLDVLLEQINEMAPYRNKISDGSIGDADHANRSSDHNPWCGPGIVTARDFTHDPSAGADMDEIAEALRQSRDVRIKYVIWNKRMFSSYSGTGFEAWEWRPYSGPNLHTAHMHVSVQCGIHDDFGKWSIGKDWFDMASKADLREIVQDELRKQDERTQKALNEMRRLLAVGREQKSYNPDNVNIKAKNVKVTEE